MGLSSTAGIPVYGRVDTGNEIYLNALATAYDALNEKMLTRNIGVFETTTLNRINGRFSVLKMLARKHDPSKIIVINKIHSIVVDCFNNKISQADAFNKLNNIGNENNFNPFFFNVVANQVNKAESMNVFNPFNNYLDNNKKKNNKRFRGIL